jgi:hypothetical protein
MRYSTVVVADLVKIAILLEARRRLDVNCFLPQLSPGFRKDAAQL